MTIRIQAILLIGCCTVGGCGGEDDKPVKKEAPELKAQIDALQKAKQVDRMILDAEKEHRKMLEERTSQGQ